MSQLLAPVIAAAREPRLPPSTVLPAPERPKFRLRVQILRNAGFCTPSGQKVLVAPSSVWDWLCLRALKCPCEVDQAGDSGPVHRQNSHAWWWWRRPPGVWLWWRHAGSLNQSKEGGMGGDGVERWGLWGRAWGAGQGMCPREDKRHRVLASDARSRVPGTHGTSPLSFLYIGSFFMRKSFKHRHGEAGRCSLRCAEGEVEVQSMRG